MRCKAYLCNNRPELDGTVKRHYFGFPSAEKEKSRLERWIGNIGTSLIFMAPCRNHSVTMYLVIYPIYTVDPCIIITVIATVNK